MKWHQRFFWLLLIFLPTQLGYHFWPDWAMVLGRRVDYLAPTLFFTDILIFCVLLCWFSQFFKSIKGVVFSIKGKNKILFFILIGLFVVLNIFVASNRPVALYKWMKVFEFALLGWYIVRSKPPFSLVATSLSIGVLYSSVFAIAQFVFQHSIGGPLWWLGERTFTVDTPGIARIALGGREFLRPYATFPHSNVLGGYLAVVLPLVMHQFTNPTNLPIRPMNKLMEKIYQWFLGFTFVVGIVALGSTFSRSAIVVGILALVLVFFRKKKIIFFLAILFLTFSFFLFPFSFFEESVVVRQQLNVAAIKLWQTSPLFGVGLGNFLVELPKNLVSRQIYFLQPVHNIYLLLLSEIGAVGVAGIVGVVWVAIRKKKRVLFVPLIPYLLLGLVDHYPLTLQQGQLLLTVLVGMSLQEVRKVKK